MSGTPGPESPIEPVSLRRLRGPMTLAALAVLVVAAVITSFGALIAGRLAEQVSAAAVWGLAACLVGGAVLDTLGRYVWVTVVDRAAGRLRHDLVDAAFAQPLPVLSEQAVGEMLDRIDDDTHEVNTLARQQVWMVLRMLASLLPMWVIAGWTWWPAWLLFPVFAVATALVVHPLLAPIAQLKVVEEAAWTDHAAALEEGIAGRDDLRTSLGQPFAVQRLARLSQIVHERFRAVLRLEVRLLLRAGLTLHLLLSAIVVAGVALGVGGAVDVSTLVTLFIVTSGFVGMLGRVAEQLPDLQAGLGAIIRIRAMLDAPSEPDGGRALPAGVLTLDVHGLDFAYGEGSFAIRDLSLHLPAGETLALVGRTGSGKSTLASLLTRVHEPPRGSVLLSGVDVRDVDLAALRRGVGVVTQRTEILAGTLAENVTLFADLPRADVEAVITELGLDDWVAGLPDGLETRLGPGGTALSAGEEQLIAFARILAREVQLVVLDEATARMDPVTEARVVAASARLLEGRTGVLIAHRLSTISRARWVGVMERGRLVEHGTQEALAAAGGAFRALLDAAGETPRPAMAPGAAASAAKEGPPSAASGTLAGARRVGEPASRAAPSGLRLATATWHALRARPEWGLVGAVLFLAFSVTGPVGALTGFTWGRTVEALRTGANPWQWAAATATCVLAGPVLLAVAVARYPRWWIEVSLRTRMAVLFGQTDARRLPNTPPGEVVARAMDSDRYVRYADRWVDFVNGLIIAGMTAAVAGTPLAGLVLLVVMVAAAGASLVGRPLAGRSAAQASSSRAAFGRALVSCLDAARTVKLAGRVPDVRRHLRAVDGGRVEAAVREHRVQAVLEGVPTVLVQVGVVAAWAAVLFDVWGLATALLVTSAATGFDWFGRVAGAVVTEAPGTRAWQRATSALAGGRDLAALPAGVDLVTGRAPEPPDAPRIPLTTLTLEGFGARHDDGTIGVHDVDLVVHRGELVLLLGQVGSGKSSLLKALAGLLDHTGHLRWNGLDVDDPELFLRPAQVAYVAQVPRVLSGTFVDNVALGHERQFDDAVTAARLAPDVVEAGGRDALVGHRGVRLSGGQVQRVALARALAADAELLLADDVSSALDATTELELWHALGQRPITVVGATSKASALAVADRVVVLADGRVAAHGAWHELEPAWGHLAG